MMKKLSPELKDFIKGEAQAHVESTRGLQGRVETYISGAEYYATKWQSSEQRLEQCEKVLKEILTLPQTIGHAYEMQDLARQYFKLKMSNSEQA